MGQSAAETVTEIREVRDRLESNLRLLEERIPQPGIWLKRALGILLSSAVGVLVLRSVLRRRRSRAAVEQGEGWILVRAEDLKGLGARKVKIKR
jgi:hypothetical protein